MCSHGDHGGGGPCSASVANFEQHSEGMEVNNLILIIRRLFLSKKNSIFIHFFKYLMEAFIDRSKVIVLNEEVESSGVKVFKVCPRFFKYALILANLI